MSLSEPSLQQAYEGSAWPAGDASLRDTARNLAQSLEAVVANGKAGSFPDDAMRELLAALVKIYATKFDEGQRPLLIDPSSAVSATAILVATSALMKSSNLEIFELGMWQSWSGTR
jgi:hypothetical protein